MYILQYDYIAIILSIINLLVLIFIKNLRDIKSRVLLTMIVNSLLTTTFDLLSSISIGNPEQYSYWYTLLVTSIYYLLNNNKVYIYLIYILMIAGIEKRFSKWQKHIVSLPYLVTTLMILLNPFTRNVFSFDSNLIYHREVGLVVLYIIAFIYLVVWSLIALRHMKKIDSMVFRTLVAFIVIYLSGLIIQTLFPRYLVQSFCTSISELILIMVLQNRNAVIDGTTQLYNQKAFYDRLKSTYKSNISASVTLIMLEDTSRIDYTLGYSYLKSIIQAVAGYIRRELKANEYFYIRSGCFALFSLNHSDKQNFETKNKLKERFLESWIINDSSINLAAKICEFKFPENIKSYSDVYDYIDNLITAPSLPIRGNQVGVTEIDISNHKRDQEVRKAIALAIAKQSFEVFYQPIYSVQEQRYISAEALARLRDPELGFIPPDEFIPLAERDGTISKLGMQIFEMVCKFLKYSGLDKQALQYIDINLSVVQCMQRSLKEQLLTMMEKYQIDSKQICLEITETVAVKSPEIIRKLFQELDKQNISFALDDYGSGYSNVNYILEIPFRSVKLDKQLIWDYFKDDTGRIALESTIAMMKGLNIELIAEGVETKDQADVLVKLGVNYLQGYYFSKPIPPEEFIRFILEKNTVLKA